MPFKKNNETYISVDIETAGPNPSQYSLLSIGACVLSNPQETFYVELKPVNDEMIPEAFAVHGLNLDDLKERGLPPKEGLLRFAAWLEHAVPAGERPIFVAFNAPFDWMFVNDYFHRYLGRNPFGHSALDIKAFYMGLRRCTWQETSMPHMTEDLVDGQGISHNALQDAVDQAEIFRRMLEGK
jgi:ribonuclease T